MRFTEDMPDFINTVLFICWSNLFPTLVFGVVNVCYWVLMERETIQVSENNNSFKETDRIKKYGLLIGKK